MDLGIDGDNNYAELYADDYLSHYGMPRRSGRYPWGSGKNSYQRTGDFLSRIDELKKEGLSDTKIAEYFGLTTTNYRTQKSLAKSERRAIEVETAKALKEKGYSLQAIADKMGYKNDSSVRSLLDENSEVRMNQAQATANILKKMVDEKGMIDVGVGSERELNVSKEMMKQALYILELEGYAQYSGGIPQLTNPGKQINRKVLAPPGTEHKEIYDFDKVGTVGDYISKDGGATFEPTWIYPKSMDSDRVKIRYAEEGGVEKDGLVEIRRGVDDLSLGGSRYAQVRILVDDNRYIKGMAVNVDKMDDGVDIVFNTNKPKGTPKDKVLKTIGDDPDNPFGSLIKDGVYDPDNPVSDKKGGQHYYYDKKGNKQLSLINKRADEGDWNEWSDTLSSQFLAKQSKSLINKQLKLAIDAKQKEYDEIMALTNPTVKKTLLKSFSDDCDSAAIHLRAASLPRQKYQVILPIPSLKDNEVYAPNYENGETVALVRFPHGGTFEIPIVTVNNKHAASKKVLGSNPLDAIGINSRVAERLSGADFDGDTVMVIPTGGKTKITSTRPLPGLEGFDPKLEYGTIKKDDGFYYNASGKKVKIMRNTQTEMGKASNLITDMTLLGATDTEKAKAVRHSMVVIDAEKHKLDYKQSAINNDIALLKKKYQGKTNGGASTLLSKAKSEESVLKRRGSPIIDPETGKQTWNLALDLTYVDPKGRTVTRTQKSTKMANTDDAHTLVSKAKNPVELAYADYANKMKALANQSRKVMVSTGKIAYSNTAKKTYQKEVDSLVAKLNVALKNAPRERQAQSIANSVVATKVKSNPDMTKKEIKKASQQELTKARNLVGAKRELVTITDREWEAIQAGAVSENRLVSILNNADIDDVRKRATPRQTNALSTTKVNRMKALKSSGHSTAEIAAALGISSTTVIKYLTN